MFFYGIYFFIGIFLFFQQTELPHHVIVISFFTIFCLIFRTQKTWAVVIASGFLYAYFSVLPLVSWTLPHELEKKPLRVTGVIASMPVRDHDDMQCVFLMKKIETPHYFFRTPIKIRVTLFDPNHVMHAGQTWAVTLKLKRVHTPKNPGAFDFETKLFAEDIRIQGKGGERFLHPKRIEKAPWNTFFFEQKREQLRDALLAILPDTPHARWILALSVGDHSRIGEADWNVLRRTGTNHLMAIAGLHLGLLTSVVYLLTRAGVRYFPFLLFIKTDQYIARWVSLIAAFFYASLSGFSIPTERAIGMLFASAWLWFRMREHSVWDVLGWAMFVLLCMHPAVVLQDSFYLSFASIAFIFFAMGKRFFANNWWWKYGRVQWVLTLGLIPFSILFYGEYSLISVLANCIAIPFLMFSVLPIVAISLIFLPFSSAIASICLQGAEKLISLLFVFLDGCGSVPFMVHAFQFPHIVSFFSMLLGVTMLLLPKHFPGKFLSVMFFLPAFFFAYPPLKFGEFRLHTLDVGQGLSILIQTRSHAFLYDTGPAWKGHFDTGASIVFPFLLKQGVHQLHHMMISHGDMDHSGGALFLRDHLRVDSMSSGEPHRLLFDGVKQCEAGQSFEWDGVRFEVLHPTVNWMKKKNNSSCVVKVSNAHHSVLLTGDVEHRVLHELSEQYREKLKSSVLIAPHHGSKTSVVENFLSNVAPRYVVFSTGYLNQYHLPHAMALSAYQKRKTVMFDTAKTGALSVVIGDQKIEKSDWRAYRAGHRRFWFD